ncbi:MAG: hypothetical protein J2O46_04560 [Nocardioides sp.]|nr:hypothetical protein [Nocardioides sp.]
MPDKLIVPPPPRMRGAAATRSPLLPDLSRPALKQAALVVGLLVVGGVVAGLVAAALWSPPKGMVYNGHWYRGLVSVSPPTIAQNVDQGVFSATGWFSVCAIVLGLVVGLVTAVWLRRSELLNLVSLAVGGVLGGLLMWWVTSLLSPADPAPLAKGLKNGAVLPDHFQLASGWLALLVPGTALLVLMLVYLLWAPPAGADGSGAEGE